MAPVIADSRVGAHAIRRDSRHPPVSSDRTIRTCKYRLDVTGDRTKITRGRCVFDSSSSPAGSIYSPFFTLGRQLHRPNLVWAEILFQASTTQSSVTDPQGENAQHHALGFPCRRLGAHGTGRQRAPPVLMLITRR